VVDHGRDAHYLHIRRIFPRWQLIAGEVQGTCSGLQGIQRHQVLAVGADIDDVVIDRVLVSGDAPPHDGSGKVGRYGDAVIDTRLDLSALFVVVPGDELDGIELLAGVVEVVDLGEGLKPRLTTLLAGDAIGSP
jgi:hypothetical protein